jgi:hypothetical protein
MGLADKWLVTFIDGKQAVVKPMETFSLFPKEWPVLSMTYERASKRSSGHHQSHAD